MLKVNLAGCSDEELANVVAQRCSALGEVNKVTVYAARSGAPARAFAIVAMGTRKAAESVVAGFGGRTVGNAALVFLEHAANAEESSAWRAPESGSAALPPEPSFRRNNVSMRGNTR